MDIRRESNLLIKISKKQKKQINSKKIEISKKNYLNKKFMNKRYSNNSEVIFNFLLILNNFSFFIKFNKIN